MASVNLWDPRPRMTMSSTSSGGTVSGQEENGMDEVFAVGKGAGGGAGGASASRFGFPVGKIGRSMSEPENMIKIKKDLTREDLKAISRNPALSDSSNFSKRSEETGLRKGSNSNSSDKSKGSPEFESDIPTKKSGSDGFPEPESMRRQAVKDFSILYEADEGSEDLGGFMHPGEGEVADMDFGSTFLADGTFEISRNTAGENIMTSINVPADTLNVNLHQQTAAEDDDDSLYPEIERFPNGYGYNKCCGYDDYIYHGSEESVPRIVLRSFDGSDNFPEVPDGLINDETMYPEMELLPVDVPELPALKLRWVE